MTKIVWIKRNIEDVGSEAPVIGSVARSETCERRSRRAKKKKKTRGETAGDICRRTPELKEATPLDSLLTDKARNESQKQ